MQLNDLPEARQFTSLDSLWDGLANISAKLTEIGDGNYIPNVNLWNGSLEDSTVGIEALTINGSKLVKLPLKFNDIKKLTKSFPPLACHLPSKATLMRCAEIAGSHVTLLPNPVKTVPQILQNLAQNTLEKMFNIELDGLDFNIGAKLDKLVICQEGGSYQRSLASAASFRECGRFGTLLLKLPVKGKQPSGKVTVENGTTKTCLTFASKKKYSAIAVTGGGLNAGKQSYTIESDTGELTVVLVFHMVWNDFMVIGQTFLPSLTYFPDLLVLTHEVKSMLETWRGSDGTEIPKFIRFPISKLRNTKKELGYSNLSAQDLVIATSLGAISFLDVNFAWISREGFKQGTFSPFSIKDDLFQSAIIDNQDFMRNRWDEANFDEIPAFVIRPRNPSLLLPAPGQNLAELFLQSLESRVNTVDCVSEKPTRHGLLSRDLEQILETLEDESQVSRIACLTCLFTRLFNISIRLNASPQKIMAIFSKLENVSADFFTVECTDSTYKPADVFFDYMCLTNGWETCFNDLAQIADHLLKKGRGFQLLSEIGIKHLQSDNAIIAKGIYRRILEALEEALPEDIDEKFHVAMAVFAIQLHENNKPELERFLRHLEHLKPPKLVELVVHLGTLLKDKILDCSFPLRILGQMVNDLNFSGFNSLQFYEIVSVFQSINEEELIKTFLSTVCKQCIEISKGKDKSPSCLFCDILEEQLVSKLIDGLRWNSILVKEALISSMQNLYCSLKGRSFKVDSHISYIVSITLLEDCVHLTKHEILEQLSHFYTILHPKDVCSLSYSLLCSETNPVQNRQSTLYGIFDQLINLMANLETNVLVDLAKRVPILESFAWHGNLVLLDAVVGKIKAGLLEHERNDMLATLISNVLKSSETLRTESTSTCWMLNRDVFNYFLLEWLRALQSQKTRTGNLFECFKHFADGERSFIDSTETYVVAEWDILVGSLSLTEALTLVKDILDFEAKQEGPSLKKFPCCWQVFSSTCHKALSMLDPNSVNLSEDHLVSLTQSLLWIGDEASITEMCRLLRIVTKNSLADVQGRIVREKRTMELAVKSTHGILGFNDLIDVRIQDLNRRLTYLFAADLMCRTTMNAYHEGRYDSWDQSNVYVGYCSHYTTLNLPILDVYYRCGQSETVGAYLNHTHRHLDWADATTFQKEINDLNALRKCILREGDCSNRNT